MDLIIDGEAHKVNNFVDFLIENYAEGGKVYNFELIIKDKYDKRLIDKRINTLQDNLLIFMNDEFEIIDQSIFNDYDKFITGVGDLFTDDIDEKINKETYKNQFVKYELKVSDGDQKSDFSFYYLNLNS
ncbi:MAG: hypothetical protein HC831_01895 [Chloroflexia bacterium]|nr:hypothetical protein [Chloroflexia bacterium]